MRKIVCSECAADWTYEHICRRISETMFYQTQPTVIYEPDPTNQAQKELLSKIIEQLTQIQYENRSPFFIDKKYDISETLELLYKLEKELE